MTVSPLSLVFTLIGGLVLAGLIAWIRRPRLIVLAPRLFTYSQLTSRGQLAELTVFNRGFKTEEAIELSLNPNLQYDVVGSSSQDSSLSKNKLSISRIGAGDEVSTVLLIEGGTFSRSDIFNCLSKETKGLIVSSIQDLPPTGQQRILLIVLTIVIPLSLYMGVYGIDYIVKQSSGAQSAQTKAPDFHGWNVDSAYVIVNGTVYKDFVNGNIAIALSKTARKKDVVTMSFVLENKTNKAITYDLRMTSNASERRVAPYDRMVSDIVVAPGEKSERDLNLIIPATAATASDRTVYVSCYMESITGDSLKIERALVIQD